MFSLSLTGLCFPVVPLSVYSGLRVVFLNYSSVHMLRLLQPTEHAFARHLKIFKIGPQPAFYLCLPLFLYMDCFRDTKDLPILKPASRCPLHMPRCKPLLPSTITTASPLLQHPILEVQAQIPHPSWNHSFLETFCGHFLSFPFNFPQSFICDSLLTHNFLFYSLCQCLTFLIRLSTSRVNGSPLLSISLTHLPVLRTVTTQVNVWKIK